MNTNTQALGLPQPANMTSETQSTMTPRLKLRLPKWLLLSAGLCLTILVVKAAVLVGQIFVIVNAIYDSSLT